MFNSSPSRPVWQSENSRLQSAEWRVWFYRQWEETFTVHLQPCRGSWKTPAISPPTLAGLVKYRNPLTVQLIPALLEMCSQLQQFLSPRARKIAGRRPTVIVLLLTKHIMSTVIFLGRENQQVFGAILLVCPILWGGGALSGGRGGGVLSSTETEEFFKSPPEN